MHHLAHHVYWHSLRYVARIFPIVASRFYSFALLGVTGQALAPDNLVLHGGNSKPSVVPFM